MLDEKDSISHLDHTGKARIVDVSGKPLTERIAKAIATVSMKPETLELIVTNGLVKGDVLAVSRIAGIMGAKKCSELIPLCHPLAVSSVEISLKPLNDLPGILVEATCKVIGQTGVEMEAMTGASITALTLYDMCKSVDREMSIQEVRLVQKKGGQSGEWQSDYHN